MNLMKTAGRGLSTTLAVGLVAALAAPVAGATTPSTVYLAGKGGVDYSNASDLNDCSQPSTPCATLYGALTQAGAGGTVYLSGVVTQGTAVLVHEPVTIVANPANPPSTPATILGRGDNDGLIQLDSNTSGVSPYAVTLSGLTFKSGKNENDGGAIVNNDGATLTITDSTFSDNTAVAGGAIANGESAGTSGTLVITDSTFSNNTAAVGSGGAIDNGISSGTGTLRVNGSTFSENTAPQGSGGAIDNGDGGTGTATITDSSFTDNSSAGSLSFTYYMGGGAILNGAGPGGNGTLTITGSRFSANTSATSGGAIANGFYLDATANLQVSNTSFDNNSAALNGGAIANGLYQDTAANLTLTGSSFDGNSESYAGPDGGGGAIANGVGQNASGQAQVFSSTFSSNAASGDGGAIDNGDFSGTGLLTVGGSTFTDSTAANEDGGAIDNGDEGGEGILTVSASTFAGGSAGIDGGAIDNGDRGGTGEASVETSTFFDNQATQNEGGAIDNGDDHGSGYLALAYSTFAANSSSSVAPQSQAALGANLASGFQTNDSKIYLAGNVLAGDCWQAGGSWYDEGFNAATSSTCTRAAPAGRPDVVSASVGGLGSLASNGGPTQTLELLAGNPAVGLIPSGQSFTVGKPSDTRYVQLTCPLTADQRGDPSAASGACDAGAVQYAGQTVSFTSTPPPGATAGGASYTAQASSSSGLPVSFTVDPATTGDACAVSGATVTFLHAGNCVIDATGPQTMNFAVAAAQQTIAVAAAPSSGGAGPSGAPVSGGQSSSPTGIGPAISPAASPLVRVLAGYRLLGADRVAVRLRCARAVCIGSVRIALERLVTVRHGRRRVRRRLTVVLGRARFLLAAGATRQVIVTLDAAGRRFLRAAGRRGLAVHVIAVTARGNTAARGETLRRRRRGRRR